MIPTIPRDFLNLPFNAKPLVPNKAVRFFAEKQDELIKQVEEAKRRAPIPFKKGEL